MKTANFWDISLKNKKGHSASTHILIGVGILIALAFLIKQYKFYDISGLTTLDLLVIGFITITYSQVPDVDMPTSHISKFLTISGLIIAGYAVLQNQRIIALTIISILLLVRMTTHRTLVHSLFGAVMFSLPLYFIKPIYAVVAFIMFLSHIKSEGEFSLAIEKDWRLLK